MSFILDAKQVNDHDRILLFHKGRILVATDSVFWQRRQLGAFLSELVELHLVHQGEQRFLAGHVPSACVDALGAEDRSLRSLLFEDGKEELLLTAGKANQILDWYHSHRFCGACGQPTEQHPHERAVICAACGRHYFPRINPCVIVLVTRGDEILLARNKRYRSGYYSCLAGFIEIGESAEETVHREVMEEVALIIDNVRYVKSQSWPFPSQLMLGYYADYRAGDIIPEEAEIEEADWFNIRNLPPHPGSGLSVAGELIAGYTASRLETD